MATGASAVVFWRESGRVRGAVVAQHNGGFNLASFEYLREYLNQHGQSNDVHGVQRRNLCIHSFEFLSRLN